MEILRSSVLKPLENMLGIGLPLETEIKVVNGLRRPLDESQLELLLDMGSKIQNNQRSLEDEASGEQEEVDDIQIKALMVAVLGSEYPQELVLKYSPQICDLFFSSLDHFLDFPDTMQLLSKGKLIFFSFIYYQNPVSTTTNTTISNNHFFPSSF